MLGPAFGGEVIESRNPVADRFLRSPQTRDKIMPVRAVVARTSEASAGNSIRHGIVGNLFEFARWRGSMQKMGYAYFIADPAKYGRVPTRRLARVRRMVKVLPNTRQTYQAEMY